MIQLYITPTASGVVVDAELTPGVQVAQRLFDAIDLDDDGFISADEQARHSQDVKNHLAVRVDGAVLPVTVRSTSYPEPSVLAAGGGVIAMELSADAAFGSTATRSLEVTINYNPVPTIVQSNLSIDSESPVTFHTIEHADEGRVLRTSYALAASVARADEPAPTPAHRAAHRAPGPIGLCAALIAGTSAAIGFRRRLRLSVA